MLQLSPLKLLASAGCHSLTANNLEQRMMSSADGLPPARPFQALCSLLQQLPPHEDALPCASAFSERINGQLVGCWAALPSIGFKDVLRAACPQRARPSLVGLTGAHLTSGLMASQAGEMVLGCGVHCCRPL